VAAYLYKCIACYTIILNSEEPEASHHKLQGAIEVQAVQGAIEVVKRLEPWVEAVAFTLCKGRSVGGIQKSAIVPQYRPRCITSRCTGTEGNAIIYDAK
jgi:hypothetical protein